MTRVVGDDGGRLQLICIRPPGPFAAFDERLTSLATRFVRYVHVRIFRTWDAPAHLDLEVGFVSRSVPTVVLVGHGRIVAKCVGDLPERALERLVVEAHDTYARD